MPTVVAEALVYLWPTIVAAIGTTGVTVLSYAIVVGAFYAYGTYQARQAAAAARDAYNATLKDRLVMTTTTDAPRSRLYGRVRNVDGVLFKNTHGSLNQFYTFVVAIAGHEIDAFEQFWFADNPLTLDGSGYVQTAPYFQASSPTETDMVVAGGTSGSHVLAHPPITGSVLAFVPGATAQDPATPVSITVTGSTVDYTGVSFGDAVMISYQWASGKSYARIRGYLGAPGQDLSADLIALGVPDVTTNHKFQGIACILVTLEFSTDAFPQGVPGFSAVVRGAKVLDPRTNTTAWSENPALCAYDWARYPYGGNADVTEVKTSTVIAAANACDVTHLFHTVDHGDTLKPMFTCGTVAPTQTDPTNTLNELVSAMAGKFAWVGGQLCFKAGAYVAPVADIDTSWLSGLNSIEIVSGVARIDLVNVYRPSIADAAQGYVVTPTEPVKADAYIELDGEELPRDITFNAITDAYHAQHVSSVMLRDSRQGMTVKLPCNMMAYPLDVFDTTTLTLDQYGWDHKEFEILTWEFAEDGGVQLVMKETAASIFDPDATFTLSDAASNTSLPYPWIVPTIANVHASSGSIALDDGTVTTRTLIEWDATTSESVRQSGTIEVQVADIVTGVWQSIYTEGSAVSVIVPGLLGNSVYVIRVRAISSAPLNVKSDWSIQIAHVVAHPASAISDWTDIPGRPMLFRVTARGYTDTSSPIGAGLRNGETGASLDGGISNRSYMMARIRRSDGAVTMFKQYDVYGVGAIGGANGSDLAFDLNASGTDVIVVVWTSDEPATNRLNAGLAAAMYRCGASRSIFGKPNFSVRSAYVLIGIANCGEGMGYEAYCDGVVDPTRQFVDVAFTLQSGNLIVTGTSALPGQLADYGYVGTLDATTDLSLVARGSCALAGNYGSKLGGTNAWDSDVYSVDSASFACFAAATVVQSAVNVMFGLNSDPTTDSSYTSLDYAIYFEAGGNVYAYESGAGVLIGTYAAGATGIVLYDGSRVRYMVNGTVLRTVTASPNLTFFFDSSFYTVGVALRNIRFGALSANDWASIGGVNVTTSQLAANAATDIFTDYNDFAGTVIGHTAGFQSVRSFSITPAANCVIEFTAVCGCKNVLDDNGMNLQWTVTPAGGSVTVLGASSSSNTGRAQQSVVNAFTALAGVALTFDLNVRNSVGSPQFVTLYESTMRVTQIKR